MWICISSIVLSLPLYLLLMTVSFLYPSFLIWLSEDYTFGIRLLSSEITNWFVDKLRVDSLWVALISKSFGSNYVIASFILRSIAYITVGLLVMSSLWCFYNSLSRELSKLFSSSLSICIPSSGLCAPSRFLSFFFVLS